MSQKTSIKFIGSNFGDFVSKIHDLTNIEDTVKIKMESENILMYSMLSNDVSVLAMKSYLLKTSDYIENFKSDKTFDFIITSAGKFVKNLRFFVSQPTVKFDMIYKPLPDDDEVHHVRSGQFSSEKLKISCVGGEEFKIRDLKKEILEQRLDPKKSKWGFKISKSDFADAKKLCNINNEERIMNISVSDGIVTVNESGKWELEIDKIEPRNTNLIFGKKYLSNIDGEMDEINFHIFDTFILVKDRNSNLMLSFEQDFSNEE
jgi:hypothetical protein